MLDEDKGFCNVDDIIVEEDRQEAGRPAKRLTREAAAGEKGRDGCQRCGEGRTDNTWQPPGSGRSGRERNPR